MTPASPSPTAASSVPLDALPSRIVVPDLRIDLPVISGAAQIDGNKPDYPICDVAQYLTTYRYPDRPGATTWIYAHARPGMFLSLLEASERDDGAELIGMTVVAYSTAPRRYTYRITQVMRHATDRSIARDVPAGERRLVLQTSEGPPGTIPKLQVAAVLVSTDEASAADALPSPAPRACPPS